MTIKKNNIKKPLLKKDISDFLQSKELIEGMGDSIDLALDSLYNTCKYQDFSIIVPKKDYFSDKTYQKIRVSGSTLEVIQFEENQHLYGGDHYINSNFIYTIEKDDKSTSFSLFESEDHFKDIGSFLKYFSSRLFEEVKETDKYNNMENSIYKFEYILDSILTTEENLKDELNKKTKQIQNAVSGFNKYLKESKGVPYMMSLYHNDSGGFLNIFPQLKDGLKEKVITEIYNQKDKNQELVDELCKIYPGMFEKIGRIKIPNDEGDKK